jgi:hypothetical protein
MDGDETIGDEINGMLCSIHELLSSVYDASPLILMSDGFHLTRIEVNGTKHSVNLITNSFITIHKPITQSLQIHQCSPYYRLNHNT